MHAASTGLVRSHIAAVVRTMIGACAIWSAALAQSADTMGMMPAAPAATPSLQSLAQAANSQDYTIVQRRRFPQQTPIVSVREQVQVDANGSTQPQFAITFLGVEGELPGSPANVEWQQVYDRFGSRFFTHGAFRVRDLAAASANYTLHDFGPGTRASRSARRMVVFPFSVDKAIWVVDVDVQTSVPLYAAEFDTQLQLIGEVEAITFSPTVASLTNAATSGSQLVPDFATACTVMGNPPEVIDPNVGVTAEYQLDRIEIRNDPLNGQWRMMMSYTDGIDQFHIVQAPGAEDFFAAVPIVKSHNGHVIGRYRDPSMSVLVFWEGDVAFHVAGRGSLRRLDDLAANVYRQAISTN
jgi:hypothetical protein